MNDTKIKKQIVEKIKDSTNVLVALNSSPSVDELSAALGITLAINKIDKHATAIFSGDIPAAIEFLEPEKTFENTVTSLQDFIIALDKEKADHLRYKVDGDMVKIFITPYRTTIDERDLEFSQGDYNVDFVLAIGVQSEDDLDTALRSHGQILTDATVSSISLDESTDLGTINWNDKNASSYSEMLTSLVKDLGDKELLDEQISTALLTGIVAATDRFSNAKTSSRVMTSAADLMAAGANQQLIAVQLEQANEISSSQRSTSEERVQPEDEPAPVEEVPAKQQESSKGELSISHEYKGDVDEVAQQAAADRQAEAASHAERELERQLQTPVAALPPVESAQLPSDGAVDYEETPLSGAVSSGAWKASPEPTLGGVLNATTEEAAEAKRREELSSQNRTILSHDSGKYLGGEPTYNAPISATSGAGDPNTEPEVRDIFADHPGGQPMPQPTQAPVIQQISQPTPAPTPEPTPSSLPPLPSFEPSLTPPPAMPQPTMPSPTLEQIDSANRAPSANDALQDIHAALASQPEQVNPAATGGLPALPPLPPMPDLSSLPPLPGAPSPIMEPNPFNNNPATIPGSPLGDTLPPAPVAPEPGKTDPGQFKIPGQ